MRHAGVAGHVIRPPIVSCNRGGHSAWASVGGEVALPTAAGGRSAHAPVHAVICTTCWCAHWDLKAWPFHLPLFFSRLRCFWFLLTKRASFPWGYLLLGKIPVDNGRWALEKDSLSA